MRAKIAAASIAAIVVAGAALYWISPEEDGEPRVRVVHFANVGHMIPILGLEAGIFERHLPDTDIEARIFDSGPQAMGSLFADAADLAYVGPGPAVNGFVRSGDIVILSGAASGGASLMVHPDSGILSGADLDGKRIAAPQVANTQDVSLRHYIISHNLAPAERGGTVFVVNIANPDIYSLFAKGELDAAWVAEPWATILEQEQGAVRLFREESLWKSEFTSVLLVARTGFVEQNPGLTAAWIAGHEEAAGYAAGDPASAAAAFESYVTERLGESFPRGMILESLSYIRITPDISRDSIFVFADRSESLGYLGRDGYSIEGIFYADSAEHAAGEEING